MKLNCLYPVPAFIQTKRLANGLRQDKIKLFTIGDYEQGKKPDTYIPCKKCEACLINKRNKWVARIMNEALKYKESYFITLTYKIEQMKFNYSHVQKFIKKIRKEQPEHISYYVVGERGTKTRRRHWHIIIHNLKLPDKKVLFIKQNGATYKSEWLEKKWIHGFICIDEFSEETAKYTAAYVFKLDEEIMFRVSKGYGMEDDTAVFTLTRGNGSGLTSYEKQKLRMKYPDLYYQTVDRIRKELKEKQEKEPLSESIQREKALKEIIRKSLKKRK